MRTDLAPGTPCRTPRSAGACRRAGTALGGGRQPNARGTRRSSCVRARSHFVCVEFDLVVSGCRSLACIQAILDHQQRVRQAAFKRAATGFGILLTCWQHSSCPATRGWWRNRCPRPACRQGCTAAWRKRHTSLYSSRCGWRDARGPGAHMRQPLRRVPHTTGSCREVFCTLLFGTKSFPMTSLHGSGLAYLYWGVDGMHSEGACHQVIKKIRSAAPQAAVCYAAPFAVFPLRSGPLSTAWYQVPRWLTAQLPCRMSAPRPPALGLTQRNLRGRW